jgi:hypothetical protein
VWLSLQVQAFPPMPKQWVAQQPSSSGFSIYCTSNLDTTGACNRLDNNQPAACEMVPGGVINCKQENEPPIQCVIYRGVIGTQAYFYCTHRTDPGIRNNRINTQRFAPNDPRDQVDSGVPSPQLTTKSDDLDSTLTIPNDFNDLIKDEFN